MQGNTRALMQWCLFVLGIFSFLGALVAFHYLGYHTDRGPSGGEAMGIMLGIAVGFAFFLVGVCNNETIDKIAEPLVFVISLATFLANIGSATYAVYFDGHSPSEGVIAVTVIIGFVTLIATIVCAIGPGKQAEKPVEQAPASSSEPPKDDSSDQEISKTNYPHQQHASD